MIPVVAGHTATARRNRAVWLAAVAVVLAGCTAGLPRPPIPVGFRPVPPDSAGRWADATRPPGKVQMRFHWSFDDGKGGGGGGNGIARMAPPDSLEFDFAGALGMGRGSAVVVGEQTIWAKPEDKVRDFVPNYPLMWAMLGVAAAPSTDAAVSHFADGRSEGWRYVEGVDTIDLVEVRQAPRALRVVVRHAGAAVGDAVVIFDSLGHPVRSRLDTYGRRTRLDMRFTRVTPVDSFPTGIWNAPDRQ